MKNETLFQLNEALKSFATEIINDCLEDNAPTETELSNKINKLWWKIQDLEREDKKYNGHVNYETWLIELWLTNDEDTYNRYLMCNSLEELKEFVENITDVNVSTYYCPDIAQDFINLVISDIDFRELWKSLEATHKEHEEYEQKRAKELEAYTNEKEA